jgi:glycosyltransferase involved in cell wall biosynthesis
VFIKDTPGRTAIHNEDFCSIAVVSFNRHARLMRLIDSIHKYADMPFELVVSDDGGTFYDDFNFIRDLRDKVSHIAVNLGVNKGLHVNTNIAVSLTRAKNVILFYDDTEAIAPFMRDTVNVLDYAPYVGVIYLGGGGFTPPGARGFLHCRTPQGQDYGLFCHVGGTQVSAFRKSYWLEVGGYSEDSMYGDQPFCNKGWQRGYFSCYKGGVPVAFDTDKDEKCLSRDSTGAFSQGRFCNYPKIFRVPEKTLYDWGSTRMQEIGKREHKARYGEPFSEFSWGDWHEEYMSKVRGGPPAGISLEPPNLDLLEKHHSRFIEQIKRDVVIPS